MKHNLNHLRAMVKVTRENIASVNKLEQNGIRLPQTVEHAQRSAAYWYEQLRQEVEDLSWRLWPETGRPYKGAWAVYIRPGEPNDHLGSIWVGSQSYCISMIMGLPHGPLRYYMAKYHGPHDG